jgi:hypothetical protein
VTEKPNVDDKADSMVVFTDDNLKDDSLKRNTIPLDALDFAKNGRKLRLLRAGAYHFRCSLHSLWTIASTFRRFNVISRKVEGKYGTPQPRTRKREAYP